MINRRNHNPGPGRGFCLLGLCGLLLAGCSPEREPVTFAGNTQGTTYHVVLVDLPKTVKPEEVQHGVEKRLQRINETLSTYSETSEISTLNRNTALNTAIPLSAELEEVLIRAQRISAQSGGAFDITVTPLVTLWHFGAAGAPAAASQPASPSSTSTPHTLPTDAQLAAAKSRVGYQGLQLDEAAHSVTFNAARTLDVDGIAQGYTVDYLASYLDQLGIKNYMVEVGGELKMRGHNATGNEWLIGIETPDAPPGTVMQPVHVSAAGVSTSGDYRDYYAVDGVRYSHLIDPATARPVNHTLASVTVIADSATDADGWATAFMVMGAEKGLALAEQKGMAAYFIVRQGDAFATMHTHAFGPYMEAP